MYSVIFEDNHAMAAKPVDSQYSFTLAIEHLDGIRTIKSLTLANENEQECIEIANNIARNLGLNDKCNEK